jgi:hypothetical protein
MTGYDAKVHQDFADLLLTRARRITVVFTAMAAIVGAGLGVVTARLNHGPEIIYLVLWTVILAFFGFVAGKERSFSLRLKAYELLCQKQIAENTEPARMAAGTTAK